MHTFPRRDREVVRTEPIWTPDPDTVANARITDFAGFAADRAGCALPNYSALWSWSVAEPALFWRAVWDYFAISSTTPVGEVLADGSMPGAKWFPGTRLNYAEHALRHGEDDEDALISITEDGVAETTSRGELRRQVGALGHWLREHGVRPGDRVVGYLPNTSHSVIAFLAAASIGAVWSACGQDYGPAGAAARFGQLEPVVLVAADGYRWNGTVHDRREAVDALRRELPTVREVLRVPVIGPTTPAGSGETAWADAVAGRHVPVFTHVDFDAPLWVLFSSGTTGVPKGIVHGHGGVVVDHHRLVGLHFDLRPGDRFFWYTTTNWMMWNLLVSALLAGATSVLYDGNPAFPGPSRLFEIAAAHAVKVLGVSPGYLRACANAGLEPGRDLALGGLRVLGSTGAPLPARSYEWVRDHVGTHVQVASTTGGTDVVSGFAGSASTTPVWAGEISAPLLGVDLQAWDPDGRSLVDEVGELVVASPMPSMPVSFWNDPDGRKYHEAYFSVYPGAWRHGDWVTITSRGTVVVTGRSDSTLNRNGVRLGSADVHDVVESLPQVSEALVVGVELPDGGYWMPLFLVPAPGVELDEHLRARINAALRADASPRHVPDELIAVPAIPHTRTGKKLEVPVKRVLQGAPPGKVAARDAVDDFDALTYFTRFVPGKNSR